MEDLTAQVIAVANLVVVVVERGEPKQVEPGVPRGPCDISVQTKDLLKNNSNKKENKYVTLKMSQKYFSRQVKNLKH